MINNFKALLSKVLSPKGDDIIVNMDGGVGGSWKEVTNKVIADNLIDQVAELLNGKARHYYVSDRNTMHEKIVIEFNHTEKCKQ
mgnify:CR=1 FL=1